MQSSNDGAYQGKNGNSRNDAADDGAVLNVTSKANQFLLSYSTICYLA